jgi:hypothetical protein
MTLQAKSKKNELFTGQASEDTPAKTKHSWEEISLCAYEIYLARGGQAGKELDDWLQAERELARATGTKATGLGIDKN